jgi:uncharacterized protein (TIGR02594 family)
MKRWFFAALAACLVSAPLVATEASARPRATRMASECNVTMPCEVAGGGNAPVRSVRTARASFGASFSAGGFGIVAKARAYLGATGPQLGLPARLWCADFVNMITGGGTGSRAARSWLSRPRVGAQVGAVAVFGRRGGGHVGVVSGFDASGNPIVISGNHGGRVRESVYASARVLAYVAAD